MELFKLYAALSLCKYHLNQHKLSSYIPTAGFSVAMDPLSSKITISKVQILLGPRIWNQSCSNGLFGVSEPQICNYSFFFEIVWSTGE